MIDDQPRRRPAGPLMSTLAVAVMLAACTSGSKPLPPTSASTGPSWSVASPVGTGPASAGPGTATGPSGVGSAAGTGPISGSAPGVGSAQPSSQSGTEARRDGVAAAVAALPARARIRQIAGGSTRATTPEGIWVLSRPEPAAAASITSSTGITSSAGTDGYAELLLLDPSGERIRRAYPFAGLPPQWLLVTPPAVFCGRSGDDAAPDAMVCRVDRATGELRVRVIAHRRTETALTEQEVAARPGRWVVDGRNFTVDFGRPPQLRPTELVFTGAAGSVLRLDPDTLQVIGS